MLWNEYGQPKGKDREIWKQAESLLRNPKQSSQNNHFSPSSLSSEDPLPPRNPSQIQYKHLNCSPHSQPLFEEYDFDALFNACE